MAWLSLCRVVYLNQSWYTRQTLTAYKHEHKYCVGQVDSLEWTRIVLNAPGVNKGNPNLNAHGNGSANANIATENSNTKNEHI